MIDSAAAKQVGPADHLPGSNEHLAQIRVRGTQAASVMHRDRQNPGDRTGKGHLSPISSEHGRPGFRGKVDTPVAAVTANRFIDAKNGAGHWFGQARTGSSRKQRYQDDDDDSSNDR